MEGIRTSTNINGSAFSRLIRWGTLFARIIETPSPGQSKAGTATSARRRSPHWEICRRTCRCAGRLRPPRRRPRCKWDLRHGCAPELLASHVGDPHRRATVGIRRHGCAGTSPISPRIFRQVIHGDITGDNVYAGPARPDSLSTRRPHAVVGGGRTGQSRRPPCCAMRAASRRPQWRRSRPSMPCGPRARRDRGAVASLVVLRGAALVVSGIHQSSIDRMTICQFGSGSRVADFQARQRDFFAV